MGRIAIDEDRCKGCEICVSVCPRRIIAMADQFNRLGYRPARMIEASAKAPVLAGVGGRGQAGFDDETRTAGGCNGCTLCARMCPDVAISVYR